MQSLNLVTRYGVHATALFHRDSPSDYASFSGVHDVFAKQGVDVVKSAAGVDHDVPDGQVAIFDQLSLGSCVLNAACAAMQVQLTLQGLPAQPLSRLFLYFLCSQVMGTVGQDTGTEVRIAVERLGAIGACEERVWGYTDDAATFFKPPAEALTCIEEGSDNRPTSWFKVDESTPTVKLAQFEAAIRANHMVQVGSPVSSAIQSYQAGQILTVPDPAAIIGGHSFLVSGVRYINGARVWRCRNSWSSGWGDNGHFLIDDAWAGDPSFNDAWVMSKMESLAF